MVITMSELTQQQLLTAINAWTQNISVDTVRDIIFIIFLGIALIIVMKNTIK